MRTAVRAIIIENGNILVMHRKKYGSQYYTLVGGRVNNGETLEQALVREVKEETGMTVTAAQLAFHEEHPEPYNEQYIYICNVAPHADIAIQEGSDEHEMNHYDMNTHHPLWVTPRGFANLPFRTPTLHEAIIKAFKKGFPKKPIKL